MVVNQHIPHIGSSHPCLPNGQSWIHHVSRDPGCFGQKHLESPGFVSSKKLSLKKTPKRGADRWPCPAESWHQPAQWSLLACPGEPENLGTFLWWGQYPIYIIYNNIIYNIIYIYYIYNTIYIIYK